MKKKSQVWFAWYPVYLEDKERWTRMKKVRRVWVDHYRFQVIDPYDLGDWVGGWRYKTLRGKP